jgi:hypothetical protein
MTNCYIDAISYKNAATGMVLNMLYGNIGRIATTAQGATSLTVTAGLATALNQYDSIYVTDGPSSEVLQVGSGGAIQGATSIPLQAGTQYAHAGGTAYCTDGTLGSLGQAIFEASRRVEDICYQSLYSTTYTGEILTMPTMRAAIDNRANLHFRPRHFPISTLTSVTVQLDQNYIVTLDPSQAIMDSDQLTVDIPNMTSIGQQQGHSAPYPLLWQPLTRQSNAWITLTYTAGYSAATLPQTITRACKLLVNDALGQLENPIGADSIQQNKRNVTFTLRGDTSGESLLYKQAAALLSPYIAQSF